ncbi:MAG: hypothetical protein AB1697_02790 [Pseudomonadota bacterium]
MAKRVSGPPRRPRNPVAKAVRTPAFRMRVVPDKRRKWPKHKPQDALNLESDEAEPAENERDTDAQE